MFFRPSGGLAEPKASLGGVKNLLIFTPKFGEDSHFDSYFPTGLKPPTSYHG